MSVCSLLRSVLVPSSFSIRPYTLSSSSTRHKPRLSMVSWRVSWVLILTMEPASNALPSIVRGLRPIPLHRDQAFARVASRSTVTTPRTHLQRVRLSVEGSSSSSRTPIRLTPKPTRGLLSSFFSWCWSCSLPSRAVSSFGGREPRTSDCLEERGRSGLLIWAGRAMRWKRHGIHRRAVRRRTGIIQSQAIQCWSHILQSPAMRGWRCTMRDQATRQLLVQSRAMRRRIRNTHHRAIRRRIHMMPS